MDTPFTINENKLERDFDREKLVIEPWGANSLRVRATCMASIQDNDWALLEPEKCAAEIAIDGESATIRNGKIRATITADGVLTIYNSKDEILLQEYTRHWGAIAFPSSLRIIAREFSPIPGGDYKLTARFESNPEEKIFGMGQYQQPYLDVKGCKLELAHRNSQASVPFALSSLGYGFLWHNPAIGQVHFGKNMTEWTAHSTKQLDYWVTAGDTPAEIEQVYARATGTAPMLPDFATGFWQCKLRYQTQDELLSVAQEYKRRELPISVIVIDFFHWIKQGDWDFDPDYWPEPERMAAELKAMGIELMVSVWPTVDKTSKNFPVMLQKGYLIGVDRGVRVTMEFGGDTVFFDATNPAARAYVWEIIKKNYYDRGIHIFWLDEAEPEYGAYDFDNYRYALGNALEVGNLYPVMYAKTFYDGMKAAGQENIVNLIRCAWAGSQRYGALVWSGDIYSNFASLRNQIRIGLNMGIAGIPWWTSDIGGFFGADINDPAFRELLVRWFQFGVFCPVFRMHGDRNPVTQPLGTSGGGMFRSGAANEVWSYGEDVYVILKKYMLMRERLRPYIKGLMQAAHETGAPPMRPLFYDFPADKTAWTVEDQFMFGPELLVAPVLYENARTRKLYLPEGAQWTDVHSGKTYVGAQWIEYEAPLDIIPLFLRDGSKLPVNG